MPTYRIFWFDQDDHISGADYLIAEAEDDVAAAAAAHLGTASAVEVWHRARLVVRVGGQARPKDRSRFDWRGAPDLP